MKVHIMTVGFTPEVFTSFIKEGGDKIVAIHSDKPEERTVNVIKELKKIVGASNIEEEYIKKDSFKEIIQKMIDIIKSTNKEDELYIHIGGGERHLALALLYATFFVDRKMKIVCTTRLPGERVTSFEHEILSSIKFYRKLSEPQSRIIKQLKSPMRLTEIVKKIIEKEGGNKDTLTPGIHRHVKRLVEEGILDYDEKERLYSLSIVGKFLTS